MLDRFSPNAHPFRFFVQTRFDALEESTQIPGLDRPVYLRRGRYYEVLRDIWTRTEATPESTFVCGDIYELDLALPAQLGARVHLVARASTPAYELDAAEAAGGWSHDLDGVLESLRPQRNDR